MSEAIATLYQQVDNSLEVLLDQVGGDEERRHIEYQQKLNGQAYFILAWGQLEAEIDEACRNVIRLGRSQEEWQHRRPRRSENSPFALGRRQRMRSKDALPTT